MTKRAQFCLIILILLALPSMSLAQKDAWTGKADMPTPRWALSTSVVDGKIYAIGGFDSNTNALSAVEEYDPMTNTWVTKKDMPTARGALSTSVVNGKIYAIGGFDERIYQLGVVEEYDPQTNTWTKKANMPTARNSVGTSVIGGKIYAIGGGIRRLGRDTPLSTVEIYDPISDEWTKMPDMPNARYVDRGISMANGKIYIMGGWMEPDIDEGVASVEAYDPSTGNWTKKTDMPTARASLSASAVNGRIYAIGGTSRWLSQDPQNLLSTVEEYYTGEGTQVTGISPEEGRVTGGESLKVFGNDLTPDVRITIGGKALTEINATAKLIVGLKPAGIEGEQEVWIDAPDLDFPILVGKFIYNPLTDVDVTGIYPDNGKQDGGDVRNISGSGFLKGATVTIGGNPATVVDVKTTIITVTIPASTEGKKNVVVTNPDGQKDTLWGGYTYNPKPVIDEITPEHGGPLAGGTDMVITGEHFMTGVVVYIGEKPVTSVDRRSSTELRLKTPRGTVGAKDVRVVNQDEQDYVYPDGFTYNRAPRISSVEPDAGALAGGTRITIIGTGFLIGLDVFIDASEARVVHWSSTKIIAITPPSSDAVAKSVKVRNGDGQEYTRRNAFTYNLEPSIISITPNNGKLAGSTEITIQGSGFLPEAKVLISTGTSALLAVKSVQVLNSTAITAIMPPGKPGPVDVFVRNTDKQLSKMLENGFTYNPLPTIISITPNYGSSAGGTKIVIEGTGFLHGARVMIGERAATTQLENATTIKAVTPSNPPGVWKVRVVNPDGQEPVESKDFISLGEMAYNYPNPFRASEGTTFRYVTDDPVQSITVKIFNLAGVPIDVVQQMDSNEVKWKNSEVRVGLYVYLMEVEPENGNIKQFRGMLEVYK